MSASPLRGDPAPQRRDTIRETAELTRPPSTMRTMSNPTLVSLFTGAGGLDAGLEAAGFRTVAANDFDKDCVATLKAAKDAAIAIGDTRRHYLTGTKIVPGPIESIS